MDEIMPKSPFENENFDLSKYTHWTRLTFRCSTNKDELHKFDTENDKRLHE